MTNGTDPVGYLKANPVVFVGILLTVVGIILAIYGAKKNNKMAKNGGIAMAVGGGSLAVGKVLWDKYKTPETAPIETTAGISPAFSQVPGLTVTTPE